MKKITGTTLGIAVMATYFASQTVFAAEMEASANAQVSSEYIFRGQTQTMGDTAISGGFDVGYGGFFAGMWASEVDYGGDANLEVDTYAGYGIEKGDFSASYTYVDYNYNGNSSLNGVEHQIGLGWKDLGVTHVVGSEGFVDYSEVSYSIPKIDWDVSWGTWDTIGDNWTISKTVDLGPVDATISLVDFSGDDNIDDERNVTVSISKEF